MGKIYGFGNALMDIEIRISEEELREIDIPKNTMKHISHDELSEYLEKYDKKIEGLHEDLFLESNPIPAKWALYKMGLIKKGIRLPLTFFSEKYHERLSKSMKLAGV